MPAADFLSVEVLGDRNLLRNLDRMPDTVRAILLDKVRTWTEKLRGLVEENIRSRLQSKENGIASKLRAEVVQDGLSIEGRVYIAGSPYARIQEEGGVTPAHIIRPRDAKILAFRAASGDKVFALHVFHPGGAIPATHFMKDAYREMGPEISRGMKAAVVKGIRESMRAGR